MKASNHDRFVVILCAAMIGIMYAIGEPWGVVLFAIFGLYYTLR